MPITVKELYEKNQEKLILRLVGDLAFLEREIARPEIERPGLGLAGYFDYFPPGRAQVIGHTESSFINTLDDSRRREILTHLATRCEVPFFVITRGFEPPDELAKACAEAKIPILLTAEFTPCTVSTLGYYLLNALAPVKTCHGVMMDIRGVGVLILGIPGIGKSEAALDLIRRGHRLVADDVVLVRVHQNSVLIARSPEQSHGYMEIRGLGIISIPRLYGANSVRDQKRIELVVDIEKWNENQNYERVGLITDYWDTLGVRIPKTTIPAQPGKSISSIVELAAAQHLLRRRGYHSAQEFQQNLLRRLNDSPIEPEQTPYIDLNDDLRDLE
ncbi:HPr(Ser) kinase/phosphatase [bacterium]|nr:HPr(Ser) kinase/phosphatase [bacterium]